MFIAAVVLLIILLMFSFVLFFGAPYLPTLKRQENEIFELLKLKPGQTLVELGSGDGRILAAAAKRGIKSIGYEINPLLYIFSKIRLWKYRGLAQVRMANFWNEKLPECDAIYVFLLEKYMPKLHNKIIQEITSHVKVISFAFPIKEKKLLTEKSGLFMYEYTTTRR